MRSPAKRSNADVVRQPGAIARAIVFSVLISAGVLLLKVWWERPGVAITLLLALLLDLVLLGALVARIAECDAA